ncbi:MAG: hypothetical protein ACMG57_05965 [Candidatus Dojkabacteria bacterium]
MRQFIAFLVVGIFFALFSRYIITSPDISPLNLDMVQQLITDKGIGPDDTKQLDTEIQNLIDRGLVINYLSTNAYLLGFSLLASILCFFVCIHLFFDKLFFKNFYEDASLFIAIRRGLLLCISIGAVVIFRLYRVETYVLFLTPVAAITIEGVFMFSSKNRKLKKEAEIPEDLEDSDSEVA